MPVGLLAMRGNISNLSRSTLMPCSRRQAVVSPFQVALRASRRSPVGSIRPATSSSSAPDQLLASTKRPPFYRRHPFVAGCVAAPFIIVGSLGVVILGLFAYDASTYGHYHSEAAPTLHELSNERGGPKNLKIAMSLKDDEGEALLNTQGKPKERLVIVGGGWGSVAILKHLNKDDYHVVVVSPDNYFLFHPLLPSATVGTVETRSLVEPLRKIIARVRGHYIQATAMDVDMEAKLLEVQPVTAATPSGHSVAPSSEEPFYIPYDRLVIACGSVNATHGVPGLEHCYQLKTVADAQAIRRRIMDNLERAALPSTTEEERKRLLSFVVAGAGPTGTELCSEVHDMLHEDVVEFFPPGLKDDISMHIIQSRDHILNTYSQKISEYAEKKFARNSIDTILNARVKEVKEDAVIYTQKDETTGKLVEKTIPSGFTLWSTGIAMNPFTVTVASKLPNQYHKKALEVDSHLRVLGAPLGTVYALGDCATIETRLVDRLLEFVDECDEDKDGRISQREYFRMMKLVKHRFPTADFHIDKIMDAFEKYRNKDGVLTLNALADIFLTIQRKMTALPATAQVANQQGTYLGKKLHKLVRDQPSPPAAETTNAVVAAAAASASSPVFDVDDAISKPFKYKHMGSLAYIGNSAVFDIDRFSFAGGLVAMYLWRSVYFSEQVSFRTRCLLAFDWIKRGVFGRDLSRF